MKLLLAVLSCVLLVLTAPASGADTPAARQSLRGITGMVVIVNPIHADAAKDGLTRERIQSDVEAKIRELGVAVLPAEQAESRGHEPRLVVNVNAFKDTDGLYAFSIEVGVQQWVLAEATGQRLYAETWSIAAVGTVGAVRVHLVRQYVEAGLDQFVVAWRSVNPSA